MTEPPEAPGPQPGSASQPPPPPPPPGYGQPAAGYGAPPGGGPGYGQPAGPSYGQPAGTYQPYPGGTAYPAYPGSTAYQPPGKDPVLAEWWERLLARLIDGIILAVPGVVLFFTVLLAGLHKAQQIANEQGFTQAQQNQLNSRAVAAIVVPVIIVGVASVLIAFGYDWLQHGLWGQTIGKRVMGTMVVNADTKARVSGGAACGRAAVYTLPGLLSSIGSLFILIDVLWLTWDPRRQCLHDKVAGSIVVKKKMLAAAGPGQPNTST